MNTVSYTGWKLVGVIPYSTFTHGMLNIRYFIMMLILLMAMMLAFVNRMVSVWISSPILKLNDSVKVICMVQTYLAPVADSNVKFYDMDWKPLETSRFIDLPADSLFFRKPDNEAQADSLRNLFTHIDISLQEARLSADSRTLSFRYTTPEYLDKVTWDNLKAFLVRNPLQYVWAGNRFVRSEN